MVTPRALLDLFVGDVEGRRVGVLPVVFGGARRLRGVVRGLLGGLARGGRLGRFGVRFRRRREATSIRTEGAPRHRGGVRSEEHTSELQSRENIVCRLLLEKK